MRDQLIHVLKSCRCPFCFMMFANGLRRRSLPGMNPTRIMKKKQEMVDIKSGGELNKKNYKGLGY